MAETLEFDEKKEKEEREKKNILMENRERS